MCSTTKGPGVLLKYNTVERKTIEDDALMYRIKYLLRWFFLISLLFFPFMFYAPSYFYDGGSRKSVDAVIYGWGPNTSRSIPLYVFPDNDTALIVGSNLCSEPLLLLLVVPSAIENIKNRATIRETWGNFSSPDYQLAFLVGTTNNVSLQEAIVAESDRYDDIIQENFVDSYNNLTLKSVMLLKFVKTRCQKVQYIFKSDDDVFVHIPNLLELIKFIEGKNLTNVLIGNLICGSLPIRNKSNKWYVPKYMFQERVFPNYLSGTGYLMQRETALQLYEAAFEIPVLHLEDVFITGLCAKKAKIRPRNHFGFTFGTRPLDPCTYMQNQNIINSHRVLLEHMRELWTALHNGTACSKPKKFIQLDYLRVPWSPKRCL